MPERHIPEFPVAWSEEEEKRLRDLEKQAERLREIYRGHYTEEAWAAKPAIEKGIRHLLRPLRDVPPLGRIIPELTPAEMRARRLELEEEVGELSRLEYVHNRLPQVQDELRMLALLSPDVVKAFATPGDVKAHWKDLERLTDEELGYLVHYARALAKATPEQIISGEFWQETAPLTQTDYLDYFPPGTQAILSPERIMSSVAFSQNVDEIAHTLGLAFPPQVEEVKPEVTAEELIAQLQEKAAQLGIEWNEANPDASMQALSELTLAAEGVPVNLHTDTGEEIPARMVPHDPYPQIWIISEETGEWEFMGLWDEDKNEWVEYHSLFGTPLMGDEEARERGAWKNLVNFNTFNSISMFSSLRGIGESLGLYFLDNFREAGKVYEPKLYITPFLKIPLPSPHTEEQIEWAKEALSKDRVTGWVERKLDEIEEDLSLRSIAATEAVSEMSAQLIKDYPTNPEYFASLKDMREEYGWGVLRRWDYFASQFIAVVPSVTVTAGTMVGVTKLTKNPLAGKVVSGAIIGSMEASRVLHELIQAGVPPTEAAKWMPGLIAVLGTMEVAGSIILLKAFAPGLYKKMIGETLRRELIHLTKKQLALKGIKKATEVQLLETLIEVAVQATGNAVLQYEGVYDKFWEGLDDVAIRVFLGFLPLSIMGGGSYVGHLHRNMVDAGIYEQYTVRKQEMIDAGVDPDTADIVATLEVLDTEVGQQVREKTYEEVRPLIEAEGVAPQITRNILDVQGQITEATESIKLAKKHEGAIKRGITMREKGLERAIDATAKQRLQDKIDTLKTELDQQVQQRKELEVKRKELEDKLVILEREAIKECVIAEHTWEMLTPTARRVYLQRIGLPLDLAAKKWADLSPTEQGMLMRDVEGAPPLESIVQDSDMVAQKHNLETMERGLNKELGMLQKTLEAQEAGAKDTSKSPTERALFKEVAQQSRARIAEIQGDLTLIREKLGEVDRLTPDISPEVEQRLDDHIPNHPVDEYGLTRPISLDAERATVNVALQENPNIASVIEQINPMVDYTTIPDGSVSHRKLVSPIKWIPGLYDTKNYVINMQQKFPDRPFMAILDRIRTNVADARLVIDGLLIEITQDPVIREVAQSEESQRRVEQARNAEGGWAQPVIDLTEGETRLLDFVRRFHEAFEPKVRVLKFERAYDKAEGNIDTILQDIFPDETSREANRADIQRAIEMTDRGELLARDEFVAQLDFGVLEGYTPWMIVRAELGAVHRGMQARGAARLLHREGISMPSMDRTLVQRMESYAHQLEAQWALRDTIRDLKHHLKLVESKIDNTTEMYDTWDSILREAQNMPPEGINAPGVTTMLRMQATVSPAVFSANPLLLIRNFVQPTILHPYRDWIFRAPHVKGEMMKAGQLDLLLKADRWFALRASQFHGIERSIMFHGLKPLFTGIPGVGKKYHALLRWWQKQGIYPKTDDIPRHRSFDAGVTRAWRATEAYKKHGDVWRWLRESGVDNLHPMQWQRALEYLAIGDKEINLGMRGAEKVTGYEAACMYNGTEVADMTHFLYERWQRARIEHGAMGRTIFNLLTFTRSYWTQHTRNFQKWTNPKLPRGVRLRAFGHSAKTIVIGAIVSSYLDELRGRKYKSYGLFDIMWWELGGLTFGAIQEFMDAARNLWTGLDPMTEEEDRWRAIRRFFAGTRRVGDLAIPLFNNFLWAIEGFTRKDELDKRAYNMVREWFDRNWTPQELEDMEYNLMELFQKIAFGTPPPDRDLLEEAREILHQKRNEIGTVSPELGTRYTVGDYGKDIAAYIKKGVPIDMICEEEGFDDLALFYVRDFYLQLQEFEELTTVGKARENYRKENPDFELLLLFWERYTWSVFSRRSAMCKELVRAWETLDRIYGLDPATSRVRFATFEVEMELRERA